MMALVHAVVVLSMFAASRGLPGRPKYIECVDSLECNPMECCRLGMGRFSIPRCVPRPDVGEQCRPEGPVNSTVYYPDGAVVRLSSVFQILCPCSEGLECEEGRHRCHDPSMHSEFNLL